MCFIYARCITSMSCMRHVCVSTCLYVSLCVSMCLYVSPFTSDPVLHTPTFPASPLPPAPFASFPALLPHSRTTPNTQHGGTFCTLPLHLPGTRRAHARLQPHLGQRPVVQSGGLQLASCATEPELVGAPRGCAPAVCRRPVRVRRHGGRGVRGADRRG